MNIDKAIQSAFNYHKTGNLQQAELIYKKILQKKPKNIDALYSLGMIYYQLGNYDLAIGYIKKALYLKSDIPEAYMYLGDALKAKGRFDDAIACYQKAITLNPKLVGAYNNLGLSLQSKRQVDDAIACYQKAITLDTNCFIAYYNLGNAFHEKGQFDDAIASYQKAIELNPNFFMAYNNLGDALKTKGQFDHAIACYQKALQVNPNLARVHNNLGTIYKDKGKIDEAESWFRQAIKINPNFSVAYSNLLLTMQYNVCHTQTIYLEHLNFSKQYAEPLQDAITPHSHDRLLTRRLKIGYVSPDFRRHPVAYFIEPVIIAHNHAYFEVFCYSNRLKHDEVTKRIKEHSDHRQEIVWMSDEEITELIRKNKIDILIDLAGHTANNRMLLFARKPAPIQLTWIGYPFTTGLSTIDYKIVDKYTDPFGTTEQFYTEKLIRMPDSFLCYLPYGDSPEVSKLPALTSGYITFGSFNNFAKISPDIFMLWIKILKEIPNSRLILKAKSLSDEMTRDHVMGLFKKENIANDRIELLSWTSSARNHLKTYNTIDIGLDTFPYNGTTTTCEAMWMGVPVITLAGSTHASRVGLSLLSNIGLTDLVAKTFDGYVSIAINLAKDLNRLQSLREHLRDMMRSSPLCDAKRFTANLEIYYRQIWERWCKSV
jgi:protein O-GlcNAc transferase